ncbi:MAG: hypothetical protein H8D87_16265 [Deltaproteobacteria bacterium]|uniref:hypothetical protein n=1 Tax=Desulfobacula sp. TaxID=2593537 RepID=UPI0019A8005F|nr:hypothetical protein [Candidatus Desulfobacula maris]MBL6993131.1 hypothetical protein [Desulfobacula sp.]
MSSSPYGKAIIKRGCSKMKTAIKHSLTTKSRPVKSSYLEIFIMDKHRSRLKQEKANLSNRINQIHKELASLDKAIAVMGKDVKGDIGSMSPLTTIKSITEIDPITEIDTIKRMQLKY